MASSLVSALRIEIVSFPLKASRLLSGAFNFLLSFGARRLNTSRILPYLLEFIQAVYLRRNDPWNSLLGLVATPSVLSHTPLVLTYRDSNVVRSRCVVYSWPHFAPWGLSALKTCQSLTCRSVAGDLEMEWGRRICDWDSTSGVKKVSDPHGKLRITCRRCKQRSPWVFRPDWLHPYPHRPLVYWYDWPLDAKKLAKLLGQFL